MRDEETGSWWQQVSGPAIHGPLKGRQLKSVFHDEVSFNIWKQEQPNGRVLKPDEKIVAKKEYEAADWEERVGRMRTVAGADVDKRLAPRTLVMGISWAGNRWRILYRPYSSKVQSSIWWVQTPIVIALGEDKRSVRAFERTVDGRRLSFFRRRTTTIPAFNWLMRKQAARGILKAKLLPVRLPGVN